VVVLGLSAVLAPGPARADAAAYAAPPVATAAPAVPVNTSGIETPYEPDLGMGAEPLMMVAFYGWFYAAAVLGLVVVACGVAVVRWTRGKGKAQDADEAGEPGGPS